MVFMFGPIFLQVYLVDCMEHHIVEDSANIKLMMSKFDLNFVYMCVEHFIRTSMILFFNKLIDK
jgi:hypothetical protein